MSKHVKDQLQTLFLWKYVGCRGGGGKKKKQEMLQCDCKVSHQKGWKNWQCAIWNDQVISNDIDTKSPDTGNKPEWYQRAEHEPDLICQWAALILTTSW